MPERVRGVQHAGPATPPLAVRGALEQVAHERFARWDQLVGQHVPGAELESPRRDQGPNIRLAVRSRLEVILQQHGLAVEQEAAVAGIAAQQLDQVVEHGDEPCLKRPPREIPLPVPVGVRDEVKDESSQAGGRLQWYDLATAVGEYSLAIFAMSRRAPRGQAQLP